MLIKSQLLRLGSLSLGLLPSSYSCDLCKLCDFPGSIMGLKKTRRRMILGFTDAIIILGTRESRHKSKVEEMCKTPVVEFE